MKRAGTWIKICGTTSLHDARLAVEAGANALGFVFAPSPRRVDIEMAAEIVAGVNGEVETIGVFVNETPAQLAQIVEQVGLSGVQLHGDEDAGTLARVRQLLGQRKLIKALRVSELAGNAKFNVEDYWKPESGVDAILLDSGSSQMRGGTGATFDWERVAPIASRIREKMPLIIAGGLNAGNVGRAIAMFQPWGVDVVSGVESEPGVKDENKLRDFVAAIRQSG
jgi:phosphoribosylanthranilate isomerase